MNDEKLSDSDMEDIAGGAGQKFDKGSPKDPSKTDVGTGPSKGKGADGGKGTKTPGIGKG
ncbi:MAG: hypothetical protein AAEJ04_09445 [Planctomycetota bacterium]